MSSFEDEFESMCTHSVTHGVLLPFVGRVRENSSPVRLAVDPTQLKSSLRALQRKAVLLYFKILSLILLILYFISFLV